MNVRYIVIEREYGSGGTAIARKAAERSGAACYGEEIVQEVAKEQHVSVEELLQYEETVSNTLLYSLFVMSQSQTGDPDLLSREAKLFVAEAVLIRRLAAKGPAIFVGHSAGQALLEKEGVVRVFIRADEETRQKRAVEVYRVPPEKAASVCRRFNRRRANYYNFCTRGKWNDPENYDLVLDSSRLGLDGCARVLAALYEKK